MIGCAEMQLGSLEHENFFPKIASESGISFRDNRVRHAMKLENVIHKKLSHCDLCKWVLKTTKIMSIFGKIINYHNDD
jgi:hypothetical protein